jgi:hypothetical protein
MGERGGRCSYLVNTNKEGLRKAPSTAESQCRSLVIDDEFCIPTMHSIFGNKPSSIQMTMVRKPITKNRM